MLYYLVHFREYFSAFNVLHYITFRAGGAILTALVLSWIVHPIFIRFLQRKKLTQTVRKDGPSSHHAKSNTPTMGGVVILATTLISVLLWARLDNRFVWLAFFTAVALGLTGFIDDYRKWKGLGGHARGLSPGFKLFAQMSVAIVVIGYLYIAPPNPEYTTRLNVPYFKGLFVDLGVAYILLAVLMIVGSSNAFNLTDGLDGLAIGSLIISGLAYAIFSYLAGHAKLSGYLRIIPVPGAGELTVFLCAIIGASLGFLWYNAYPAEIFMGDTGSLFLGGVLGLVAVVIKQELSLLIVGGLFAAEALSVLMQVYAFRLHGKRIFKMAPLHHHFELSGWPESKVTIRFWIISIVLALVALTSLKLR